MAHYPRPMVEIPRRAAANELGLLLETADSTRKGVVVRTRAHLGENPCAMGGGDVARLEHTALVVVAPVLSRQTTWRKLGDG